MTQPAALEVRIAGDPVLREVAPEVTNIDDELVRITDAMIATMHAERGIGLAAPQVGVSARLFVYTPIQGEDPSVLINPEIHEPRGSAVFPEGCLSLPGMAFDIMRPAAVTVTALDLDGNELTFDADRLAARVIQHELDHLDGTLMTDHLSRQQRRDAERRLKKMRRP